MLGMMTVAVVALVLGLALLVLAAGLFWRASDQPQGRGARQTQRTQAAEQAQVAQDVPGGDAAATIAPAQEPATGQATGQAPEEAPDQSQEPASEPAPASDRSPDPAGEDVPPEQGAPAGRDTVEEPAGEPIPESRNTDAASSETAPTSATAATAASSATSPASGLFAGRRARRQWAQSHGYEYAREDRYLPGEWPDSLMSLIRDDATAGSATTVARDLVSGFTGGHQFHLAEVNGTTVVALRREVYSPVQVHLSDGAAMPAGMRHSELCDRPPYTGYSSDNRALDRMLDSRVDAALHALAGSVSDIAFSTTWVAMKMSRRTDPPIWDHVIVQGRALVAASRVLPPRVTSQELDMTNADPTRPRVRGTVEAAVVDGDAADSTDGGDGADGAPTQRGHLRAVPDAGAAPATPAATAASGASDVSDETGDPEGTTGVDAPAPEDSRPRMERSATPVDFPTRAEARTMGDVSGFPGYPGDGDDGEDGEARAADPIPAVGEDPEHSRTISGGGPRVIRASEQRSTIFGDDPETPDHPETSETSGTSDGSDVPGSPRTTSAEVDIIGRVPGQASRGRHRAPSARHARRAGEAGEDTDYPEVDAEVVDPEDT